MPRALALIACFGLSGCVSGTSLDDAFAKILVASMATANNHSTPNPEPTQKECNGSYCRAGEDCVGFLWAARCQVRQR
jgi:hypothetical protein